VRSFWLTTASAGVNVLTLQRMLGHTSANVTLDTYADLFDDDLDAVAASLRARYSREVTRKCAHRPVMMLPNGQKKCRLPAQTAIEQWRWRRDLNPRTGVTRHTLSRRAP
jgi:hypothetical protein